ncbi:MAG TPA: DUF4112 domain-containing protein [Longimicrobium sp.]|nr:DUF4112 domain-containing protein [Longimicrobium sp.]
MSTRTGLAPRHDIEPGDEKHAALVRRLDALAHLLDNSIPIPGTGTRFGLDAVVGLIPGIGDAVGGLLSTYIVLEAARLGAGPAVVMRMLLNVAIEMVVGAVPIVGDLFDAGWKANARNVKLLHTAVDAPGAARKSSALFVAGVFVALLLLFAGSMWLVWWVLSGLFSGSW